MVLTMHVRFLSCLILSACHGFLLTNKTGSSSVGTSALTDYHYLMLTDALGAQKQLLSQMETFVLQLKNQLKTVNQEVKDLKSGNSAAQSLAVVELKNETSELRVKTTRLQNSYDILQKKFNTIQNENNVLKHDNDALKSQIIDSHNLSIYTKQQLESFTHSIAASNIQNVTTIQSNVDTLTSQVKSLNTRVSSLSSTSTSRGQDFLALLNKTNVADLKFHLLEQNFTSMSSDIRTLKGRVQVMNQPVALTSCTTSDIVHSSGQIIKFPSIKTSIGINNVADFKTTGKFTCEKTGVYLFMVRISYLGTSNADFELIKNSQLLSLVMIIYGTHSNNYYSGSGSIVVQMNVGDTLSSRAHRSMKVTNTYSCFTVLKIN